MNQDILERMHFYESEAFARQFDSKMNMYDLRKRLSVVYDEMIDFDITDLKLLDAGCGTGWFSKYAVDLGAEVTSLDLGPNLLAEVSKKCMSTLVVGSILDLPFADNTFDVVVSSEVIEHVPNPIKAIEELYRVTKPSGTLVVTTPNKFWFFSLWIANKLKLRPYDGLENWLSWRDLRRKFDSFKPKEIEMIGIHLFPFVIPALNPILDFFHRFRKYLGPIMVNVAIKIKK